MLTQKYTRRRTGVCPTLISYLDPVGYRRIPTFNSHNI